MFECPTLKTSSLCVNPVVVVAVVVVVVVLLNGLLILPWQMSLKAT